MQNNFVLEGSWNINQSEKKGRKSYEFEKRSSKRLWYLNGSV